MAEATASSPPPKKRKWKSLNMGNSRDPVALTLFGASQLLLHIPPWCNSSLPVWQSVRDGQVQVEWDEMPYSISIRIAFSPPSTFPPEAQRVIVHGPQPNTTTALSLLTLCPALLLQSPPADLPSGVPAPTGRGPTAAAPSVAVPRAEWVQQAYFHTRPVEHVSICDDFLLGHCAGRWDCPQHHTPYPFHWQLRRRDTHQWISTSHSAQLKLERLYCNAERDWAHLRDPPEEFTVHFDTMAVEKSERYDAARRLSNTSDPERNPHFPTEWKLYWQDCFSWQYYRNDIAKELLAKMENGETCCRFFMGPQEYEVDFSNLTQKNLTTGYLRKVRCRPKFRSPLSISSHLRTVILSEATQPICYIHPNFNLDPLVEFFTWYPPVWTPTHNQDVSLVEVPFGVEVYQKVHNLFHSTMLETRVEIVSIQQIQNVFQWDKYQRQKQHMLNRSPHLRRSLEQHLFHGTTEDAAKDICWNNFDPRVSGKNGVVYGCGSYFARDASYSNNYTQAPTRSSCRHMFLAKVLVGNMSVGKKKYCRPPPLKSSLARYQAYDTCVNQLANPSIFVVFDSCQCYPYYLIKYRPLSDTLDAFK
ncbi:TCDD-inducible poly-like [Arapaima gigas]